MKVIIFDGKTNTEFVYENVVMIKETEICSGNIIIKTMNGDFKIPKCLILDMKVVVD